MEACLNFGVPPSSSTLPNNRKTRKPSGPYGVPALTAAEASWGVVALSHQGRSYTTRSALKWLKKVQHGSSETYKTPQQQPYLSHLLTKHCDSVPSSREGFSQHRNRNRYTLTKAAQKLAKEPGRKSPKKQSGRVLDKTSRYGDSQLSSEPRKDSTTRSIQSSSFANDGHGKGKSNDTMRASDGHGKGKSNDTMRASKGDDSDDNVHSTDRGEQPGRVIPQLGASWWRYAVGSWSLVSAAVAVKGIESGSAHASVGHGGGHGQQPPSGGSGGSGGGESRGSDGGSGGGESFFGDLIYGSERKREEEPPRAVSIRRRIPDRLPARSLASLSSAAGDLMDGEAPIGGGGGGGRGGRDGAGGRMSRDLEEAHHNPNQGSYSAASFPFDGMRESHRESMARNYNPSDPFFSGGDGRGQDRPSTSSSSLERSGTDFQDSRGRDAAFPMMERSTGFNSSSTHYPSGKQPQQYHKNFAQDTEFSNAPPRGDDGYYSHAPTSRRDSHQVPQEFSSIRGKITEIPGYVQKSDDESKAKGRHQASDFAVWFGGLFNSILGKRTDSGTGGQSGDSLGKKELVSEAANRTLQMISDKATESGLAKSTETGALRRLQRETFSDLLKIRERLDKLEHDTGAGRGKNFGDALAGVKTTLKGEVNAGGAYVLIDDLTTNLSRFALQHAGLLTGLDVRFTFETPMRENDLLTTQCGVGQASGESDSSILGGPISLQKINYVAQVNDALSLAVAPLGAKASDMAETVNHLQGQALTTFAGSGPTMYQHCRGSAIGASLRSNSVMLSMSQFLSGWGNRALDTISSGPLCLSTLAQIMIQPCEHMVFSMSAVNNVWPCPPLPSSSGFHWSEMGPLVLGKTITRPTQPTGTFTFNDLLPSSSTASFLSQVHIPERDSWSPDAESRGLLGSSGTSMQYVAFSGEVDLGGHVSIGGWAQVERADWLEELERKDFQWNLSLAKSSGRNVNWGLSMGRRKREDWGEDGSCSPTSGPLEPSSQLQLEAFVKLKVGRGFSLQPGLVYILDKDTQTPAFMLRSSWTL